MGCLCSIWNSNGISHWQRNKAAEIKAAGVRVVKVAAMLLMSMAGPAVTGRWLLYRRLSLRAQRSAPFRQSPSCSSSAEAETELGLRLSQAVILSLPAYDWQRHNLSSMLPLTQTPPTAHLGHLWDECPSSNQPCLHSLIRAPRKGPELI